MKYLVLLLLVVFIVVTASLQPEASFDRPSADAQNPVNTQDEPAYPLGKSTRYGLFKQRISGRVIKDPDTNTGKLIRGSTLEFTGDDTERVPLRQGVRFGYRYWLK